MRTYHPITWSKQARVVGQNLIEQYKEGEYTFNDLVDFCQNSYRHVLVRRRIAKRIARHCKKGVR